MAYNDADSLKPLFLDRLEQAGLAPVVSRGAQDFCFALWLAQNDGKHPDAKALKAFGGAGVLEVAEDHKGSSYRAVYTVKFAGVIYALQKKSKHGIATPLADIDLIRTRLKIAEQHYEQWRKTQETGE
jgi:phage-related protein